MLTGSATRLIDAYDVALLDLDGVVYIGPDAVAGAPEAVQEARRGAMRVAFVTNNASRTPQAVAQHLSTLGVHAETDDVVTSAQAAAGMAARRWGEAARVVCLGASGLREALEAELLVPVGVEGAAVALVTGYGPDVPWREVMRAAVRVKEGLPWVASNTDMTIPTPYGVAPGHGVQVEMIQRFAGVTPQVAGKPSPPLLEQAIRRTASQRPIMVGDRLDTDIAGAAAVGIDSLLVLTGVTGLRELVAAAPAERPTYIGHGLEALGQSHTEVTLEAGTSYCGGWEVTCASDALEVRGRGEATDWWRAIAVAAWAFNDRTGRHVDVTGITPPR